MSALGWRARRAGSHLRVQHPAPCPHSSYRRIAARAQPVSWHACQHSLPLGCKCSHRAVLPSLLTCRACRLGHGHGDQPSLQAPGAGAASRHAAPHRHVQPQLCAQLRGQAISRRPCAGHKQTGAHPPSVPAWAPAAGSRVFGVASCAEVHLLFWQCASCMPVEQATTILT